VSKHLASRAISASKAVACCRRQSDVTESAQRSVFGQMLSAALELRSASDFSRALVFVPSGPRVLPPIPGVPLVRVLQIGRVLPVGAVVLLGAAALGTLARQIATIATLESVLKALDTIKTALPDDCEACVKRGMWKQSRKQLKMTVKIRRRQ
jgi:hypothetical protein